MNEKETLESKIRSINQFQFLCFIPAIVTGMNNSKAIDAAHAHNAALFRLFTIGLGLSIFVVLQIIKFNCKKKIRGLENATTSLQPPIPPPF